jgi:hypothetical protein
MPPRKKSLDGLTAEAVVDETLTRVKTVVRYLSKNDRYTGAGDSTAWPASDVDAYLNEFYKLGYTLHSCFYIGENPEGIGMVYVMTIE